MGRTRSGVSASDPGAFYVVMVTSVPSRNSLFDLNMDNVINTADLDGWLSLAATVSGYSSPFLRGDTDLDRDVGLTDYNALATNFDPVGFLGPHGWPDGNSDGDNNVDLSDYNVLTPDFKPLGYAAEAVPEPTAALLALLGMLLVTVLGRLSKNP
ncbi:MAG: hypothetical protein CMJ81_00960 [Planctomycetaceae bacterium]|nr:hypothetical protein [Planctomycetaceae bacterium]